MARRLSLQSFLLPPRLLGLGACMSAGPVDQGGLRVAPPVASQLISQAADQVRRCYRFPRIPRPGRQIVTRLRVRYAADGHLIGLPELLRQDNVTPENQAYAPRMAEAAIESVIRCSPLRLPPELHAGGWEQFDLTFYPGVTA